MHGSTDILVLFREFNLHDKCELGYLSGALVLKFIKSRKHYEKLNPPGNLSESCQKCIFALPLLFSRFTLNFLSSKVEISIQ